MLRRRLINSYVTVLGAALLAPHSAWALDSYRYLHVTIETPWFIFLFLLPMVLAPLILLVVLYWRFSFKRPEEGQDAPPSESSKIK